MKPAFEIIDLAYCETTGMGSHVSIHVLEGRDADLHWAAAEIERLESLWSRFRPSSDVSRVNASPGRPVRVSGATVRLVQRSIEAWTSTGGAFNPLLGLQLARLGYDRSFDHLDRASAGLHRLPPSASPAATDVVANESDGTVTIPADSALDLGGIAKGWTADLLVDALVDRGAAGACVNVGGDLAVAGDAPHPDGWLIEVEHRSAAAALPVLALRSGGAATSTVLNRRWAGPAGDLRHHLLDPSVGGPATSPWDEVTVVASSGAEAEVLTKVAFVAPHRFGDTVARLRASAVVTAPVGSSLEIGTLPSLSHERVSDPAHAR